MSVIGKDGLRGGLCAVCVVAVAAGGARAGDIVFGFDNPSFGGNPFNSGHLLGLAEIQNRHEAPEELETTVPEGELFASQLRSRLLASLSQSLSTTITDADPGTSDTVTIGDQEIFYERSLDSIRVVITNLLDGTSTTIDVPVLEGL